MKQLFALFCAIILMPTFSAHAWIGGPFSNNTYFGGNGDDGIYEAVAIPQSRDLLGNAINGIGIYRWAVGNNFAGVPSAAIGNVTVSGEQFARPNSGNLNFGGISQFSHSWFIQGVSYFGSCTGIVNSAISVISAIGAAESPSGVDLASGFQAEFVTSGKGVPVRRFEGIGNARTTAIPGNTFETYVFGSKVSDTVIYFGE